MKTPTPDMDPRFDPDNLLAILERCIEAKIACAKDGADEGDELERIRSEELLETALKFFVTR